MAFLIANWGRISATGNEPSSVSQVGGVLFGTVIDYAYLTADTQAVVAATANYFSAVATDLTVGDTIRVYSTTDLTSVTYLVTAVTVGSITASTVTIVAITGFTSARFTMTAAQFIAAYAAPITVLTAPGANRMYTNVNAMLAMTYGSAQFTTGGASGFQYGVTANLASTKVTSTTAAAAINALTASSVWTYIPVAVAPVGTAVAVNAPISFSNDTAAFAVGTGATFVGVVSANIVSTV